MVFSTLEVISYIENGVVIPHTSTNIMSKSSNQKIQAVLDKLSSYPLQNNVRIIKNGPINENAQSSTNIN